MSVYMHLYIYIYIYIYKLQNTSKEGGGREKKEQRIDGTNRKQRAT